MPDCRSEASPEIVAKILDAVLKVVIAALPKDGVTITTTPASGLGGIVGIGVGVVGGAVDGITGKDGLLDSGLKAILDSLLSDLTGTVSGITKCVNALLPLPVPLPGLPLRCKEFFRVKFWIEGIENTILEAV